MNAHSAVQAPRKLSWARRRLGLRALLVNAPEALPSLPGVPHPPPGDSTVEAVDAFDVLDWRRRVFALYAAVRAESEPASGHDLWRRGRDRLFAEHPASPLLPDQREAFRGLTVAPYDPAWRFQLEVRPAAATQWEVQTGTDGIVPFERLGVVSLSRARRRRRVAADDVRRRGVPAAPRRRLRNTRRWLRRWPLRARHRQGSRPGVRRRAPGHRPQLRVRAVLRVRPRLGLSVGAGREPESRSRSRSASAALTASRPALTQIAASGTRPGCGGPARRRRARRRTRCPSTGRSAPLVPPTSMTWVQSARWSPARRPRSRPGRLRAARPRVSVGVVGQRGGEHLDVLRRARVPGPATRAWRR